jgi:hypothetical protein
VSLVTIQCQQLSGVGQVYLCVVANSAGTATVHNAKLFLVLCYEYYNRDGYPFNELADMNLTYSHANGNGERAVHLPGNISTLMPSKP